MNDLSEASPRRAWRLTVFISCVLLLFASGGVWGGASAAPATRPSATAHTAVRSAVRLVATTTPGRLRAAAKGQAAKVHVAPLLRPHRPSLSTEQRATAPRTTPRTVGHARQQLQGALSPTVEFDGVDAIQSKAVAGYDVEPPDEGLGAGNGYVANFVNVAGAIYRTDGSTVTAPFFLNTFFDEPATANLTDTRVYYDSPSRTWFATMLEYGLTSDGSAVTESHVDLAVSSTANPAGAWHIYRASTTDLDHAGCPCLADYPIMGVSRSNVYLSTNEFTSNEQAFNGAQLYVLSKSQLVAGRATVNTVNFQNLAAGGAPGYHVQPANTVANAPAEFMLSSLDPNSTFDNRLAVWAVTNESSVTTGHGMPSLSVRVIGSEAYGFPPNAQTPPGFCNGKACDAGLPTTGVLQTDFDAMQETQYINGRLVGALNTGVTVVGDTVARSGVAWFVIKPTVNGASVGSGTRVTRQGYVSTSGEYLLYPHLNMTSSGAMALVFGLGGPGTYPSAAYATARAGRDFGPIQVAAAGTGPDNGFSGTAKFGGAGRWGDYSNGEIIPGTNRVWLATQYIPNTGDGNANWGNAIFELRLP
ncbi:hypothetical protein [Allobranchiibius sp. GilTou38]|uniref:hypothetical protein n=1 Tax=Allobranchiibius sp. GilTou38 TaxID=2815210 RepID=UPI001AA10AA6|nr:hypothetical protein [Allobranchiibius sp. GilTou38]MBO1766627.1 hypothetical protein [Allobranchiibius sp. GilTou38]